MPRRKHVGKKNPVFAVVPTVGKVKSRGHDVSRSSMHGEFAFHEKLKSYQRDLRSTTKLKKVLSTLDRAIKAVSDHAGHLFSVRKTVYSTGQMDPYHSLRAITQECVELTDSITRQLRSTSLGRPEAETNIINQKAAQLLYQKAYAGIVFFVKSKGQSYGAKKLGDITLPVHIFDIVAAHRQLNQFASGDHTEQLNMLLYGLYFTFQQPKTEPERNAYNRYFDVMRSEGKPEDYITQSNLYLRNLVGMSNALLSSDESSCPKLFKPFLSSADHGDGGLATAEALLLRAEGDPVMRAPLAAAGAGGGGAGAAAYPATATAMADNLMSRVAAPMPHSTEAGAGEPGATGKSS